MLSVLAGIKKKHTVSNNSLWRRRSIINSSSEVVVLFGETQITYIYLNNKTSSVYTVSISVVPEHEIGSLDQQQTYALNNIRNQGYRRKTNLYYVRRYIIGAFRMKHILKLSRIKESLSRKEKRTDDRECRFCREFNWSTYKRLVIRAMVRQFDSVHS